MKRWIIKAATAASLAFSSLAHAGGLPVIDWVNLVQTTMTALQSVKDEVYQNTNIVYQRRALPMLRRPTQRHLPAQCQAQRHRSATSAMWRQAFRRQSTE